MATVTRVVVPAPYWGQPGHLGVTRIGRFIHWLDGLGAAVVVLRAGSSDRSESTEWGKIVTVRDPIGFYRDLPEGDHAAIPLRRKNVLRRTLAYLLLVPDPLAAWAYRAAHHPLALEAGRSADLVLASSPPESVHLAAESLARSLQCGLIVDFRDGWLDEPVAPLLASSRLQRWRHARLESRILRRADRIVVTSERWRRLLIERLPFTADITVVLTNAYPERRVASPSTVDRGRGSGPPTLLYAGKLSSSRLERRVDHLLMPLVAGLREDRGEGRLLFVGNLDADERRELAGWAGELTSLGWQLEVRPAVPRDRALELIGSVDGLLLLSSSMASLPAKLFDYLPARRPILAVAPRGSAVWQVAERVPQITRLAIGEPRPAAMVAEFMGRCRHATFAVNLPEEFAEDFLRPRFSELVAGVVRARDGDRNE